ncbi:MAG: SsrA-binding protein SmpB [Planctomycetes bacterium]|nr:SsrA-binding protein SmpB [Planctomycetota bacterium]
MSRQPEKSGKNERRYVNRKARHEFNILESVECGIELAGPEVKSIREGNAKIDEAYARIRGDQVFLIGMNIASYPHAPVELQPESNRDRRLLLHGRQIAKLQEHVRQKGRTLVPLALYFARGWAKIELGLAVGKRAFDKRQDLKKKDHQRQIEREIGKRKRR